jgi:hypothetical protein
MPRRYEPIALLLMLGCFVWGASYVAPWIWPIDPYSLTKTLDSWFHATVVGVVATIIVGGIYIDRRY